MILSKEELLEITGGTISSSVLNSISKGITTLVELGRMIGSAIRRITSKKVCSF